MYEYWWWCSGDEDAANDYMILKPRKFRVNRNVV